MEYSLEFNSIIDYFNELNSQPGGRQFSRIRELKYNGTLIYDFNVRHVSKNFKNITNNFINKMNDIELERRPYTKRFLLQNDEFIKCFKYYGYEFGCFLNNNIIIEPENNKLWLLFPLFFKEACKRYNIKPYSSMYTYDIKTILKQYIDLNCGYSSTLHRDRDHREYEETIAPNCTLDYLKYIKYDKLDQLNANTYIDDEEEFRKAMSVLAEKNVYLGCITDTTKETYWLSRDYGDNYGYDILFTEKNGMESLKEVKSSCINEYFYLSEGEYNTMVNTFDLPNTEYEIIKFKYNRMTLNCEYYHSFRYDKENNILINKNDENHICTINRESDINGKIKFKCTPMLLEEYKKLILSNN